MSAPKQVISRTTAIRATVEQQYKESWLQEVPEQFRDTWAKTIGEDMVQQNESMRELSKQVSKRMSAAAGMELELTIRSGNVTGIPPGRPLSRAYHSGDMIKGKKENNNYERINQLLQVLGNVTKEEAANDINTSRALETLTNMTKVQMSTNLQKVLKSAIEKVEKKNKSNKSQNVVEITDVLAQIEKTKLSALYLQQTSKDVDRLYEVTWGNDQ